MFNLCVLDAKTLGEDIDLGVFNQFGPVSIYSATSPEEVETRIKNQEVIITNKVRLNESNLKDADRVRLICVAATGTNNIDLDYARSRNITVTNVAGYSTHSVAQHTFAMLFYLLQSLPYYDNFVKSGRYTQSEIFTHLNRPYWELQGKNWGIIGLGTIGSTVANLAQAFGCQVSYYSTSGKNNNSNYTRMDLDELLACADIVSIHAPLNPQTQNLIGYKHFQRMRRHAVLLNLGRGGIVNEKDLAVALDEGLIGGAALDVLEKEPIDARNPLLQVKNSERLLITPHIAWASVDARQVLVEEIALNIEAFQNGHKRNQVN